MRTPSKLPPELPLPVFSTREALDAGVTPSRLRARDLTIPYFGVRSAAPPATVFDRCQAYSPRLRSGDFFSHTTAAALYEIPLPRRLQNRAEIDVTGRTTRPRAKGVVGHRARGTPVTRAKGFPATDPAWLLTELATVLTLDELVVACDGLVRRKWPPTTLVSIAAILLSAHGAGVRAARVAIALARRGTDSPMETRLRLLIVRAGLPEPVIGHEIYSADGDYIGRPDLAYVAEKIAIEYEGDHHRSDPRTFADDIERRERMQEADWYVIRVISDHVYRWPVWLASRISRVVAERGAAATSNGQQLLSRADQHRKM